MEELGLGDLVKFTEYVPDEEICPLMCGALAFVFPSIYEGFGLPPLEAMACGVPVLTTHAASLPEVVGEDAVVADPIRRRALPPVWNSCTPTKPCGRSCGKLVRNVRHSSRGSVLRNSCTRCIRRLAVSEQRKLRILQVNKAYYPHIGGIESLVRTFSRELQKRAEVQVLVCQEKGRARIVL